VAFAISLILVLSIVSTIRPVRAIGMNLWVAPQNWNICVGGSSTTGNLYLWYETGPASKTWVVIVSIGLNGGGNVHYANWNFLMLDSALGYGIVGEYAGGQSDWIVQGLVFSNTMTASFSGDLSLVLDIGNPDSRSQCFSVQATAWLY
jgi:hypothetical protein